MLGVTQRNCKKFQVNITDKKKSSKSYIYAPLTSY